MRILADYHHSGLFYSLKLLFEDRLGGQIYRPIGEEWFDKGFFQIAKPYGDHPTTIKQYLHIDPYFKPIDGSPPLNTITAVKPAYYEVKELAHGYTQKALSFEQFLATDIDMIIASIPDHWVSYTRLRDQYKPKAKVICQLGNIFWQQDLSPYLNSGILRNLMASTAKFDLPSGVNAIFYHQEQPLRPYKDLPPKLQIASFVHLFPRPEVFRRFGHSLPQAQWRAYGALAPDGALNTLSAVYDEMQKSSLIWHVKPHGDGYGWVWHSAFMLGRPVITNFSDYRAKLGGLLFTDGETGIDLEARSEAENIKLIAAILADRPRLAAMSRLTHRHFDQIVNYDQEAKNLKRFLACLY